VGGDSSRHLRTVYHPRDHRGRDRVQQRWCATSTASALDRSARGVTCIFVQPPTTLLTNCAPWPMMMILESCDPPARRLRTAQALALSLNLHKRRHPRNSGAPCQRCDLLVLLRSYGEESHSRNLPHWIDSVELGSERQVLSRGSRLPHCAASNGGRCPKAVQERRRPLHQR
jgi:hypothetical protein